MSDRPVPDNILSDRCSLSREARIKWSLTFEHGADIGIRGFGRTLEEAFARAARVMFSLMVSRELPSKGEHLLCVQSQGYDLESLFVSWLNVLLSQADIHNLVLCHFAPVIDGLTLTARVWGLPRESFLDDPGVEVKGATLAEVLVQRRGDLWMAQCVVDV